MTLRDSGPLVRTLPWFATYPRLGWQLDHAHQRRVFLEFGARGEVAGRENSDSLLMHCDIVTWGNSPQPVSSAPVNHPYSHSDRCLGPFLYNCLIVAFQRL